MNDLDYIVKHLSLSERAAQLAEEAARWRQRLEGRGDSDGQTN